MALDAERLPPSLRDVARQAGVSGATASRALRGLGKVSDTTRARVQQVADALGYAPDPGLAVIASYRQRGRERRTRIGVTVVIAQTQSRPVAGYLDGLRRSAQRFAMDLRIHELPRDCADFSQMLSDEGNRGCQGLVLACQKRSRLTDRERQASARFAIVAADHLVADEAVHRVTNDFYHAVRCCWDRAVAHGYRRIGLFLDDQTDRNSDGLWSAGFLWSQAQRGSGQASLLPICRTYATNTEVIDAWRTAHHPDVIISRRSLRQYFQATGVQIPRDLGYLKLSCDAGAGTSGMTDNSVAVGARIAQTMDELLRHRQLGLPDTPTIIQLRSTWHPGTTIRPQ